eukprot:137964_1
MNKLQKTTQSGYLLVTGYIREFCNIFKLHGRITFRVQLLIIMYYPPNYHIFGLDTDNGFTNNKTRLSYKKLEVFSLLCDDITELWCNYDRFVMKTTLNEIYFSNNYRTVSSSSGFYQIPQKKNNKHNDYVNIISDGKFGEHVIMVSKNNKFYAFGPNTCGQYGCGQIKFDTTNDTSKIFSLKNLKRIFCGIKLAQIKTGIDHTIFLTENGRIYCCGANSQGQIGILNNNNNNNNSYQLTPTLVPFLYDIISIDCGRKHNLCLNKYGHVYCFGFNEMGQLGLPYIREQYIDVPVVNQWFIMNNIRISAVRCGYDFSLCIDTNGLVYLFGSNECGQVGNGKEYEYSVNCPYLLFNKQIREASLGYNHCVLVDIQNNIYTFGANNNSQCSVHIHPETNIVRPYHLEKAEIGISRRRHIYKVIAGHSTTLIITSAVLMYDSSIYSM